MLAVPSGFLPDELLTVGETASQEDMFGPSLIVEVPAMIEEDDGTEIPFGQNMEIVLIDMHVLALSFLRKFDPVTEGPEIRCFLQGQMDVVPHVSTLLEKAYEWLGKAPEERVAFYSADEAPQVPATPPPKKKGNPTKPKVTVAVLAEQLSTLAETIPAISSQLLDLQAQQRRIEASMQSPGAHARVPHKEVFGVPRLCGGVQGPAQSFLKSVGPPPRVREIPPRPGTVASALNRAVPLKQVMQEDEPILLPSDEGCL